MIGDTMAGRNQKFSLNPEINFFGDGRFITDAVHVRKRSKADKYDTAKKAWAEAFPGRAWPHWAGSAMYAYECLEEAGWIYSTRYGWRKKDTNGG